MTMFNDVLSGTLLNAVQFTTRAMSNNSTAAVGELTGSAVVVLNNTGGTPGNLTTRTAAQMIGDGGLTLGQTWLVLLVNNQGTGVLTLVGGTSVTVSGTATVAINSGRLFVCTMNTATTITMAGMVVGWLTTV